MNVAEIDVAIVGGGAAGIAAGRALAARGRSVLLVEALPRLGGRAHTVSIEGMPLDLGCGWLHSARRNPFVPLAQAAGLPVDRGEAAWGNQLSGLGFPAAEQEEAWEAYAELAERLQRDPPASDRAGDAIARDHRWRPFLDAIFGFISGAELDYLSAADVAAYDAVEGEANWRLPSGYGAFIASLAAGLPQALGTTVGSVDEGRDVVLETDRGPIRARAAIVTASTDVLARGRIRMPAAADGHLEAAGRLPLGIADKVYLALADPAAVPPESHLIGRRDSRETGSHYLRPFGRPVVESFLGGALARALEERDAAAFAIEELGSLLGADFARGLRPLAVTRWAKEPTIGGSYSHALPGHAGDRGALARPVSERLSLAGEACSAADFSTAHGAWQSGIAAAEFIARGLDAP